MEHVLADSLCVSLDVVNESIHAMENLDAQFVWFCSVSWVLLAVDIFIRVDSDSEKSEDLACG
jgi:hypothetical protein